MKKRSKRTTETWCPIQIDGEANRMLEDMAASDGRSKRRQLNLIVKLAYAATQKERTDD